MVIRASALSLPFRDGCFDLVTAFEVMEHLPDDLSALTEANRVLRPGGWLFLTVPNKWWIFETHGGVVRGLGWIPWNRIPLVSWLPQKLHDRIARARIYTLSRARELVERAGLRIQDCGYVTAPLDVLPEGWLRKCLRRCIFNKRTTRNPLLAVNLYLTAQSSVMLSTVANSNP
jgi:SAM-dependent methyltransferase